MTMPKVRVGRDIVVRANDVVTILYAARAEPYERVPSAHAEIIVACGAGERIAEDPPAEPAPAPRGRPAR